MIKKILCAAMITATVAVFASCGCTSEPEPTNPPESIAISNKIQTGQYVSVITNYKWINEKTGDTLKFNGDGTFSGKINKKSYSGTFTLNADKKQAGIVHSDVTLEGKKKAVKWTLVFPKDTAHMTVNTNKKKVTEDYVAEWAIEKQETTSAK